ncbi:hypothetical protein PV326_000023 [Microctonus aethiopoides]|nr:hypothetical protein PV326_000023 [Microctonus aethiopoides]
MGKATKQISGVAGLYRTIPHFDDDNEWPPVPKAVLKQITIPIEPFQPSTFSTSQNPMASLASNKSDKKIISDGDQTQIKQDNDYETPFINHPRESVELIRNELSESDSPRQKINKMKKLEMKKKGRAPILKSSADNNGNERSKIDTVKTFHESEIEI